LAVDDVFKKTFLSYNIDEKKVAQAAAAKDCKAALIMYFAFTGDQVKLSKDVSLYRNCSAYAWLVNAKTREITKSSHLPLVQINDETNGKIDPSEAYKALLGYLATHLLAFSE
jgi:hypothetical protein